MCSAEFEARDFGPVSLRFAKLDHEISIPSRNEIVRLPIGDGPKHITVARIPVQVIAAFKGRR